MASGVPAGYHSVQPYVIFRDTVAAIAFYQKAFGATERMCMRSSAGRVVHAELELGDSCVMMADESVAMDAQSAEHFGGSPVGMMFYTADCDATYLRALDAGAVSLREPTDEPYGARMAGVRDPFGYKWWIATQQKAMTRGELESLDG